MDGQFDWGSFLHSGLGLAKEIADLAAALATVALAIAAFRQLPLLRQQLEDLTTQLKDARTSEDRAEARAKEKITLDACLRYDFDPVLDEATKRLWNDRLIASNKIPGSPRHAEERLRDTYIVLNYFEGLACGIFQNVYDEKMVKDNLANMFEHCHTKFIKSPQPPDTNFDSSYFPQFCKLCDQWFPPPQSQPEYQNNR